MRKPQNSSGAGTGAPSSPPRLSALLRSLLPGFLPLLAYILAEAVWGETVGLLTGIGLGLAEFGIGIAREKRADPFVAADTALLALAGGLSLLLENEIFFKLKPAVIELVFAGGFGLLLVLPAAQLKSYLEHQLRGFSLPGPALIAMKGSLARVLAVLILHAGLTVWAALALSTPAWGFVSGGLLYLLFGLLAGAEFLAARRRAAAAGREELLPLVDEQGRVIGTAPRSACHAGPGKLHPVVHLHIVNSSGDLLLQKRGSSKQVQPGKWDTAVGGHVAPGEDVQAALARELDEELGVSTQALAAAGVVPEALHSYRWDSELESELVFTFRLRYAGPFKPDGEEVVEARFWKRSEIAAGLGKGVFTPNFELEYGLLARKSNRA